MTQSPLTRAFVRWFYVPMSPRWLAALRIVTVLTVFFMIWPPDGRNLLDTARGLEHIPRDMWAPVGFTTPFFRLFGSPTDGMLDGIRWVVTLTGVLVAVGLFTRVVSVLFALSYLLYTGFGMSYGTIYSLGTPLYLLVLFGPFFDWGAAWSLDRLRQGGAEPGPDVRYGFAIRATHALMGMLFFFCAVTKVWNCHWDWFGGGILVRYIMYFNFGPHIDPSYVAWLGQEKLPLLATTVIEHPTVGKLLELQTLLFEGTFFVTFFWRRTIALYVAGGLLFHVCIHLTIPPVLGVTWLPLYVAAIASIKPAPPVPTTLVPLLGHRVLLVVMLGVEAVLCIAGLGNPSARKTAIRRDFWPFLPQVMFAWPLSAEGINRRLFDLVDSEGKILTQVSVPEFVHTRLNGLSFDAPEHDKALGLLASKYVCEQPQERGLRKATAINISNATWKYGDLLDEYRGGKPYTPTKRKPLRSVKLTPCP
ncbi:MAG: hypothetical protein ABI321_22880 [Polyangia bacterium]